MQAILGNIFCSHNGGREAETVCRTNLLTRPLKKIRDSAQNFAWPFGYYEKEQPITFSFERESMNQPRNTDEFVRLFSLYTNNIYSYIHVLAPVHADAEDIFQDTSRTLWEKFGEYHEGPDSGFLAWALAIARIEVLRYRQRQGQQHRLFTDRMQAVLEQAAIVAIDSVDSRIDSLSDCYQKLAADDRQLLDSRYGQETAVDRIAAQLGRSVHSVYRSLRRIHRALFECVRHAQSPEERQP